LNGSRDYSEIDGEEGLAAYPAGNTYLYSLLSLAGVNYNIFYS
jgi:hypothetical protein